LPHSIPPPIRDWEHHPDMNRTTSESDKLTFASPLQANSPCHQEVTNSE